MHQTSTNYNEIIYNKCMQVCKGAKEPKLLNHQGISNGYKLLLDNAIQNIKFEYCSIFTPRPLCIVDNGYAGIGLRLILKK